jgi:hypothetical protein
MKERCETSARKKENEAEINLCIQEKTGAGQVYTCEEHPAFFCLGPDDLGPQVCSCSGALAKAGCGLLEFTSQIGTAHDDYD